ncbi:MAG: Mrp/NBP35 family ATP-binding protein [Anaerolineaceae bacterium]
MNSEEIKENVLKALSMVQDPELHKDLVSLGMIHDLKVDNGLVSFEIQLTTPACPLKSKIQQDAVQAVRSVESVKGVDIKMGAVVPSDGKVRGLLKMPVRHAVAVASGKGGVGKSTVAVNIAVSLAKSGARVGLMDADIYGPNIPTMMGVEGLPAQSDGKIIPAEAFGVKLMSIGFLVRPGQALIWRGPMLHSAIRQFLSDVEWGELDYLIIDLPPGTGDAQLSLAQSIPLSGGVIVTLPQAISVEDAARGLHMFHETNVPLLGIIENMSYLELPDGTRMEVFGKGGGETLSKATGIPLLCKIPMDPSVRKGGDEGRPIVVSDPDSPSAKALISLAEQLAAKLSVSALTEDNSVKINMIG